MNTSPPTRDDLLFLNVARRPLSGPDIPWSRRRFLMGVGAAGVVAMVGLGCTSEETGSPIGADSDGAFPRTVKHAAGSTVIERIPNRIVAATDGGELAALLALGAMPVGFGQRNDPLTPWIAEAGGGRAEIKRYELAGEPNFEVLAGWRPDLIVGQYGFVTEETIASYGAVAPTVSTSFVGWRTSLRQVAASIGADDRAAKLIAELEVEIAATGKRLAGASVQMRWLFAEPDYLGQLNDQSPIGALLTEMGLRTLPRQIAAGEAADEIVAEQLGGVLADADAVVVLDFEEPKGDSRAALEKQPLYPRSPPASAGRVIELGADESNAAYFDSVLTVRRNLALIERVIGKLR